jgi:hypothetical protein
MANIPCLIYFEKPFLRCQHPVPTKATEQNQSLDERTKIVSIRIADLSRIGMYYILIKVLS